MRLGKSSNLYLGFQCFSADTIATFLFSTSFDQLSSPDFRGDIVQAVDKAIPAITLGKFSGVFVWLMRNLPHSVLILTYPSLKGLVIFRRVSWNDVMMLSCVNKLSRRLGLRLKASCEIPS